MRTNGQSWVVTVLRHPVRTLSDLAGERYAWLVRAGFCVAFLILYNGLSFWGGVEGWWDWFWVIAVTALWGWDIYLIYTRRAKYGSTRRTKASHRGSGGGPGSSTGTGSSTIGTGRVSFTIADTHAGRALAHYTGTEGTCACIRCKATERALDQIGLPADQVLQHAPITWDRVWEVELANVQEEQNRESNVVDSPVPILAQRWANLVYWPNDGSMQFGSVAWNDIRFDSGKSKAWCKNHTTTHHLDRRHVAPMWHCACGWYGYRYDGEHFDWKHLGGIGNHTCILITELRGKIIEHELGYRAQYQQVIKCYVPPCVCCGKVGDKDSNVMVIPGKSDTGITGDQLGILCKSCYDQMKLLYKGPRRYVSADNLYFGVDPADPREHPTLIPVGRSPVNTLSLIMDRLYSFKGWDSYVYLSFREVALRLGCPVESKAREHLLSDDF